MLLQRIQRIKLYAACCALERAVVMMGQRVLVEVAQVFETLVTHLTYVQPFVRVRSRVSLQHAEFLLAICTL